MPSPSERTTPLFGFLNIDKPAGWSSRAAVSCVQRILRPAKLGHAGTLDPLATGVLVLGVGPATRLVERVQQMPKRYVATFLLGQESETEDTEGEIRFLDNPPNPTRQQLEKTLLKFLGTIEQMPPRFSAKKIAGKRAYKLAREGKAFELQPKQIQIDSLSVIGYEYPKLELDVVCGSGTYIRSLGRDIAQSLGTAAVMTALRRMSIGCFDVASAIAPEEITAENILQLLQPATLAVERLPQRLVSLEEIALLFNGQPIEQLARRCKTEPQNVNASIEAQEPTEQKELAAIDSAGQLIAILRERSDRKLWPVRNFVTQ